MGTQTKPALRICDHATVTPPTTPTEVSSTAHHLFYETQTIRDTLSELSSLAPGKQTNTLLTRLVNLCIAPYSSDIISHFLSIKGVEELCRQLRPLCSTAEGELENHWAHRIIAVSRSSAQDQPTTTRTTSLLNSFPYYQNYLDLSRLECSTLEAFLPTCSNACRPSPCKIAFIGSGPMPLTSFCMLDRYPDAVVHNIDRDAQALRVSQTLSQRLGYGERMTFTCEDVNSNLAKDPGNKKSGAGVGHNWTPSTWKSYQVVFLAALVGMDTVSKTSILESLAKELEPGTLVVARSAKGMRTVLYPTLELSEDLHRIGYEILAEVHPWTKVVNSVVVLRVAGN